MLNNVSMLNHYIAEWKASLTSGHLDYLDRVLADDCVFYSPAVHSPQKGKALTKAYLTAAKHVLTNPSFTYVGEWVSGNSVVLEFQLELEGVQVNGIDIITWNASGQIVSFKVMMRPLKGLNAVVGKMAEMLQAYKP